MKAIKLASVFAVSAVAAAVSTTTFAAEPVFTGTAGLEYQSNEKGSDAAASRGEVNIVGDTGVVYFKLDMEGSTTKSDGSGVNDTNGNTALSLDAIYVKQGAVQFGDFDGSLIDSKAYSAGVEEDNDGAKYTLGDDLGVRYMVTDDLTVAVEVKEGDNRATFSGAYEAALDSGLTLGLSAGFKNTEAKNQIVTVGAKLPLGMATLSAFAQTGKKADLKVSNIGLGVDLSLTEQLTLAAQYYDQSGETLAADKVTVIDQEKMSVAEVTAYYTVGDVKYYASYVDYDAKNKDYSVVGAKVSF
ncbi:MAG: hypothetical protein HWE24_08705 [Oceanospirillaceae bacterium]|nr:hypothetical protein [Oceanospirillaceae bacterium]